ncbi:hypothetical protein PLESTB_000533200 [Pleodorina starrii]|uniref:Coiled-coil domain-containing protein 40 n=1 Tax=Pleodorina starrii TaxID=330485 RepID=A0A9W6BH54_9CHLO|nr:hypothetical protein PLESTM_000397400 [Pleodorina starrii]GLC51725.1 hypothetical protein PLESTB_000533200 [Pleodorina starrii]GLC72497.1 hypothetical protein PLESTF_001253900 [Pleodorina starrii]
MAEPPPEQPSTSDSIDARVFGADGGLRADHPLLRRAQEALRSQFEGNRTRLQEELREKVNALKQAKSKREALGVELYGFQQNLAKLQLSLEQTHQNYQVINRARQQCEEQLTQLRQQLTVEEGDTKGERTRVEKFQLELDRLGATLKQVEEYNEAMKGEIAVTRRAAYAAEEAVQKMEKSKMEQDFRIDTLQENLKSGAQQLSLVSAQLEAQKRETRAALETLAEAEAEMENVHFEKKQLVAQWKSSLLAIQKRDEALSAIQDGMREQQQQELSLELEIEGYKKDVTREQLKHEALTAVVRKVEGDSVFVQKQIEAAQEKQSRLQEIMAKLAKSLEHTEAEVGRVLTEKKALQGEADAVERAITRVAAESRAIEEEMLSALSDQTTAEKATSKTASDTSDLRRKIRAEELAVVETENELAKLQVDILNTEAHNTRLAETLGLLDEELRDKGRTIEKYELEIKRRNDEIEKKTREIDILNRRYERILDARGTGEETGPLEATIKNLQREIDTKAQESKELQRRWINYQQELVGLQNENGGLTETLARLRAEHTVLFQKKRRLEQQLEGQDKAIKGLNSGMARLHVDLQRVNGLIATNSAARAALAEDNFNLEGRIMNDLRVMEEEAARINSQIDEGRSTKRDTLAEIVEAERQIMLWERKIQLEKEMAAVMDPTIGQDVVGEMKKEIHRMQLRLGELMRLQEKLVSDMEKALMKREIITVKGRATVAKAKASAPPTTAATSSRSSPAASSVSPLTRSQLDKATTDLARSIKDTEREIVATEQRLSALESQRMSVSEAVAATDAACQQLRAAEEALRLETVSAVNTRYGLLLATARAQRTTKRLEDLESGRYRPVVEEPGLVGTELAKAQDKLGRVVALLEGLKSSAPHLSGELDKVLCHVVDVR